MLVEMWTTTVCAFEVSLRVVLKSTFTYVVARNLAVSCSQISWKIELKNETGFFVGGSFGAASIQVTKFHRKIWEHMEQSGKIWKFCSLVREGQSTSLFGIGQGG